MSERQSLSSNKTQMEGRKRLGYPQEREDGIKKPLKLKKSKINKHKQLFDAKKLTFKQG